MPSNRLNIQASNLLLWTCSRKYSSKMKIKTLETTASLPLGKRARALAWLSGWTELLCALQLSVASVSTLSCLMLPPPVRLLVACRCVQACGGASKHSTWGCMPACCWRYVMAAGQHSGGGEVHTVGSCSNQHCFASSEQHQSTPGAACLPAAGVAWVPTGQIGRGHICIC